jgi:hypothetical protein
MRNNGLYYIAIVLLVLWFIGAFIATVGKIIHLLLVLAIILILLRVRRSEKNGE